MTEQRRRRKSRARGRLGRAATQATWLEWPPGPTKSALLALAALVLVTLAVYGNALGNDFVFDDHDLVVQNEQIRSLENIPAILGFGDERRRYRPVRFVSYTVDHMPTSRQFRDVISVISPGSVLLISRTAPTWGLI